MNPECDISVDEETGLALSDDASTDEDIRQAMQGAEAEAIEEDSDEEEEEEEEQEQEEEEEDDEEEEEGEEEGEGKGDEAEGEGEDEEMVAIDAQARTRTTSQLSQFLVPPTSTTPASTSSSSSRRIYLSKSRHLVIKMNGTVIHEAILKKRTGPIIATRTSTPISIPTPTRPARQRRTRITPSVQDETSSDERDDGEGDEDGDGDGDDEYAPRMTMRQRAMVTGEEIEELVELPLTVPRKGTKSTISSEDHKLEQARRRKQLQDARIEEEKSETIAKLLAKESTKTKRKEKIKEIRKQMEDEAKAKEFVARTISFRSTIIRHASSLPTQLNQFSLPRHKYHPHAFNQPPASIPIIHPCVVCSNPSHFTHPHTTLRFCSYACVKQRFPQHIPSSRSQPIPTAESLLSPTHALTIEPHTIPTPSLYVKTIAVT